MSINIDVLISVYSTLTAVLFAVGKYKQPLVSGWTSMWGVRVGAETTECTCQQLISSREAYAGHGPYQVSAVTNGLAWTDLSLGTKVN